MATGVLLVTSDAALAAAVPRLCALAGLACETHRDSHAAREAWRDAVVVLVGADVAPALAAAGLPRRAQVFVLTTEEADAGCWRAALGLGASTLLRLPDQEAALVDELRVGRVAPGNAARLIAVLGGCGGAGASTLAAALAFTAADAGRSVLIDGDPLGGGLDVLIGAESTPGVRWNELASTRGQLDPEAFASAICDVHGTGLLSWGRPRPPCVVEVEALETVMSAARHAFDTVVIDVGRFPSRTTCALLDCSDVSVVVVPADVRAVSAAASIIAALGRSIGTPLLVVRDPGGGRLSAKDVAGSLGLPLVATLRSDASVLAAAQRGELPTKRRGPLTQVCEDLLSRIASGSSS